MPIADPREFAARAARVQMIVFDIDGVLTDGSINLTSDGVEIKCYNVRDGFAIKAWMTLGQTVGILTGRGGPAVSARMQELGITHVIERSKDKGADIERLAAQAGIALEEVAFMGDDWPDAPAMRMVGVAIAPADAVPEIRAIAHLVTAAAGGRGAAREAVEHLIEARSELAGLRARYDL
ncbi:MAG: HAD hydrolase family protein [Phycisphaeraceae bacterium]|nr:HAD hydrolase family protein [Phycisphaeraceae bacterium]MCW5762680.1 HAD hydrolase family protein [Phycisphaeraceae bacterium]